MTNEHGICVRSDAPAENHERCGQPRVMTLPAINKTKGGPAPAEIHERVRCRGRAALSEPRKAPRMGGALSPGGRSFVGNCVFPQPPLETAVTSSNAGDASDGGAPFLASFARSGDFDRLPVVFASAEEFFRSHFKSCHKAHTQIEASAAEGCELWAATRHRSGDEGFEA